MAEIRTQLEEAGVVVLADAWLSGGFASKKECIRSPSDVEGLNLRAAGKSFEGMLLKAGSSIASMPSSEIYTAMQLGVLDAAMTSSGSMVSYRLYEQVACLTAPGEFALWFMYQPILISKRTWSSLTAPQRAALRRAGAAAQDYFATAAAEMDVRLIDVFSAAGVDIVVMSDHDAEEWLKIAERTSYAAFAEKVKGGADLIEMARAVK
jgi:TRAP-type C4-dicarboxylate transport system substrate-binding protein